MRKLILILVCIGSLLFCTNSFAQQEQVNVHGYSIDDSTYDATDAANLWTIVTTATDTSEIYTTWKMHYFATFANATGKGATADSIRVVIFPLVSYDAVYWASLRATDSLYLCTTYTLMATTGFYKKWSFTTTPYVKFVAVGLAGNDSCYIAIRQLFTQ
jgi:hypothetical protein